MDGWCSSPLRIKRPHWTNDLSYCQSVDIDISLVCLILCVQKLRNNFVMLSPLSPFSLFPFYFYFSFLLFFLISFLGFSASGHACRPLPCIYWFSQPSHLLIFLAFALFPAFALFISAFALLSPLFSLLPNPIPTFSPFSPCVSHPHRPFKRCSLRSCHGPVWRSRFCVKLWVKGTSFPSPFDPYQSSAIMGVEHFSWLGTANYTLLYI